MVIHFPCASTCRNALQPGECGGRTLNSAKSHDRRWLSRKFKRDGANLCSNPGLTGRSRLSESWLPSPIIRNCRSEMIFATRTVVKENGARATKQEFSKKP